MATESKFTFNRLRRLYIIDRLSAYKIADKFGCDPKTVYYWLKKYRIKRRSVTKPQIGEEKLINLYEKRKLSLKQIGVMYDMSPAGILKRMKKNSIPLRKSWDANTGTKKPFLGSQEEKAYLIGFRLGDLGVRKSSIKTRMIKIDSNTTKSEQVALIKNLFNEYAKVWIGKPNKIDVVSVSTILHPSFDFLLPKNDNIEGWIKSDDKNMTAFTAGYIDAEGSFGVYNIRGKFRLGSYEKVILKQINNWLKRNQIKSILKLERKKKFGQNKDFWRITVNEAKSLMRLYKMILPSLKHSKRRLDFTKVIKNIDLRLQNGTIQL